ncbi:MAG: HAD-IIB family hydrolase [Verrucomicrobiota bacterium]
MRSFSLMNLFDFDLHPSPRVLASDLDGTLIPLPASQENLDDLAILAKGISENQCEIVYATGRHFESAIHAIEEYCLPEPQWLVCDVGTSVFCKIEGVFERFHAYEEHLFEKTGHLDRSVAVPILEAVGELKPQGPASQGPFKISYFTKASRVEILEHEIAAILDESGIPYVCMGSVDPFSGKGLIDLLPKGVSKAYALIWLSTHADFHPNEMIYAGDSGNDYAAMVAGFRSIAVGNASRDLVAKVRKEMDEKDASERFYASEAPGSSGVLEGCRHFGLVT